MDLKQRSADISQAFQEYKTELQDLLNKAQERQDEVTAEYRAAYAHGDASENAALSESIMQLGQNSQTIEQYSKQLESLVRCVGEERYNSIGMVKIYTTVHLRSQDSNEYFVKIYPAGVSAISRGIMAADTDIAKAIMNHKKDSSVQVEHKATGKAIKYTIVDLY